MPACQAQYTTAAAPFMRNLGGTRAGVGAAAWAFPTAPKATQYLRLSPSHKTLGKTVTAD